MFNKLVVLQHLFWLMTVIVARDNSEYYGHPEDGFYDSVECGSIKCNRTTQVCVYGMVCECKPEFEYREEDGRCHLCPTEGNYCTNCCFGGTVCYGGRCQHCWKDQNGECISQDSLFFLTAAQVALATAMVVGVAALATLLYKTFRSRARASNEQILENEINRSSLNRASLSSMQVRVLHRLRDRPPKYETRHNYEFHQREQRSQQQPQRLNTTPVSRHTGSIHAAGDPPPAYDDDVVSITDAPPPYSSEPPHPDARIAIIGEQRLMDHVSLSQVSLNNNSTSLTTRSTQCNRGVVNMAFEGTPECCVKSHGHSDIRIIKSNDPKEIHI